MNDPLDDLERERWGSDKLIHTLGILFYALWWGKKEKIVAQATLFLILVNPVIYSWILFIFLFFPSVYFFLSLFLLSLCQLNSFLSFLCCAVCETLFGLQSEVSNSRWSGESTWEYTEIPTALIGLRGWKRKESTEEERTKYPTSPMTCSSWWD